MSKPPAKGTDVMVAVRLYELLREEATREEAWKIEEALLELWADDLKLYTDAPDSKPEERRLVAEALDRISALRQLLGQLREVEQ